MPAWSLSGSMLMLLTAPVAGDRSASKIETSVRDAPTDSRPTYRLPPTSGIGAPDYLLAARDARFEPTSAAKQRPVHDPQADSVRGLLRDRMARRGGALDARVEWRLTGGSSDLGLGGGLARVVDTILND